MSRRHMCMCTRVYFHNNHWRIIYVVYVQTDLSFNNNHAQHKLIMSTDEYCLSRTMYSIHTCQTSKQNLTRRYDLSWILRPAISLNAPRDRTEWISYMSVAMYLCVSVAISQYVLCVVGVDTNTCVNIHQWGFFVNTGLFCGNTWLIGGNTGLFCGSTGVLALEIYTHMTHTHSSSYTNTHTHAHTHIFHSKNSRFLEELFFSFGRLKQTLQRSCCASDKITNVWVYISDCACMCVCVCTYMRVCVTLQQRRRVHIACGIVQQYPRNTCLSGYRLKERVLLCSVYT